MLILQNQHKGLHPGIAWAVCIATTLSSCDSILENYMDYTTRKARRFTFSKGTSASRHEDCVQEWAYSDSQDASFPATLLIYLEFKIPTLRRATFGRCAYRSTIQHSQPPDFRLHQKKVGARFKVSELLGLSLSKELLSTWRIHAARM